MHFTLALRETLDVPRGSGLDLLPATMLMSGDNELPPKSVRVGTVSWTCIE